jgi:hypothetical protein
MEAGRDQSPDPRHGPAPALDASQRGKRKASQFSLRSLTRSLSKRPRVAAFRQWAVNVYRGGSRRLRRVYRCFKHPRETHSYERETRKIGKRIKGLVDAAKDKTKEAHGAFEYGKETHVNQEWWKDGVKKYRAPSWMFRNK